MTRSKKILLTIILVIALLLSIISIISLASNVGYFLFFVFWGSVIMLVLGILMFFIIGKHLAMKWLPWVLVLPALLDIGGFLLIDNVPQVSQIIDYVGSVGGLIAQIFAIYSLWSGKTHQE